MGSFEKKQRDEVLDANVTYHRLLASSYDSDQTFIRKTYARQFFAEDINSLLRAATKPIDEMTILDCGAGTGNLSLRFLELGCRVVGVDISREMLEQLKEKLPSSWGDRFEMHVSDIDSFLENETRKFDIVCSSSFLHHLPDYLYTYRLMTKRCAQAGQVYTAYEPRGDNHRNAVQRMFTDLDERLFDFTHRKLYNPAILLPKVVRKLSGKRNPDFNPYALVDVSKVEDTSDGIDMERLRAVAREEGLPNFRVLSRCVKRTALTTWLDVKFVRSNNVLFSIAS